MPNKPSQAAPAILAMLAIVAGAFANVFLVAGGGSSKLAAWLITVAMIVLLCACIGRAISARWDGVLIDSRNRISLSRLQMVGWTLVVLSAVITAGASNLALDRGTEALVISIPNELLLAMGISAASLAATPALLTLKGDDRSGKTRAAGHANPDEASWLDVFRGDEQSDKNVPDLSKIQQFLITLALVGVYAVAIGNMLANGPTPPVPPVPPLPAGTFWTLPPLNANFVWLLGISHAGYLSYKAASKPGNDAPPKPRRSATPKPPKEPPAGT